MIGRLGGNVGEFPAQSFAGGMYGKVDTFRSAPTPSSGVGYIGAIRVLRQPLPSVAAPHRQSQRPQVPANPPAVMK